MQQQGGRLLLSFPYIYLFNMLFIHLLRHRLTFYYDHIKCIIVLIMNRQPDVTPLGLSILISPQSSGGCHSSNTHFRLDREVFHFSLSVSCTFHLLQTQSVGSFSQTHLQQRDWFASSGFPWC